jgi:hypothetical protein
VREIRRILEEFQSAVPKKVSAKCDVYDELQRKFEKEKAISKEVATERMNYRRIALALCNTKSSRRKLPNHASTFSVRQLPEAVFEGDCNSPENCKLGGGSKCASSPNIKNTRETNKLGNDEHSPSSSSPRTQKLVSARKQKMGQ